jgi:hypothetical protein
VKDCPAAWAGAVLAWAVGVYQAGVVTVRRARSPVVGEIVGDYRPAGEV